LVGGDIGVWGFVFWCSAAGKSLYIVSPVIRFQLLGWEGEMKNYQDKDEIRWQVVKAMLDEFPILKQKVKNYVKTAEN